MTPYLEEASKLLSQHKISPVELTRHLKRIEDRPLSNNFLTITPEAALQATHVLKNAGANAVTGRHSGSAQDCSEERAHDAGRSSSGRTCRRLILLRFAGSRQGSVLLGS
jgi:hypothetical protein